MSALWGEFEVVKHRIVEPMLPVAARTTYRSIVD
jgi:hypothetical protein